MLRLLIHPPTGAGGGVKFRREEIAATNKK